MPGSCSRIALFILVCLAALAPQASGQVRSQGIPQRDSEPIDVPLNLVGVFDTSFLNRRNPPLISGVAILKFDNRTSNRTIVVKFEAPATANLSGYDGKLSCQRADACEVIVNIPKRTAALVPVSAFGGDGTKSFSVSFVEETEDPAQSTGFFYVNTKTPPDDSMEWGGAAAVGGALEPDTGGDDTLFSVTTPYGGGLDRHFNGSGELRFKKTIGDRADADVTVGYKDGDLGAADQTLNLQVNKYRINVYAMNGVTLSFGKFTFAAPTSALAIRERGEGYRLAWTHFAVSHIVRRESATGEADDDNRDDREVILEANNLSQKSWKFIRSANLIVVYGHQRLTAPATEDTPATEAHSYMTAGGELFISPTLPNLNATLAVYGSRGRALGGSAFPKSSGLTTFGTASWTFFDRSSTLTFSAGASTMRNDGDDATANRTYVGEHTLFEPDTLFIAGLSGKLDESTGVGPGLSNKRYAGLSYSDERFSPLHLIAKHVLHVPETDIPSKSSTLTWHHYQIGRDALGLRASGDEVNALFQVETPANIETQLLLAYFVPRGPLKSVFGDHNPWTISARVKVSF